MTIEPMDARDATTGDRDRVVRNAVESRHTSAMPKYEKIAISLPSHAAERVRRAVKRGEAPSVSAYITSAIEEKAKVQSREEFLREMTAESGGPPTLEERNWARRMLGKPLLTALPGVRPKRRSPPKRRR